MEGQELRDGKARVRRCLIDPLMSKGMVRKRGHTIEDHEKLLASLEARLAYMVEEKLLALADVVETYARGPLKNTWPSEVSIMNWARLLQIPPASQSRLVRSYLQSEAGRAAKVGGYLVELFRYLKHWGAPPNTFSMEKIRAEAETNKGRRARIQREVDAGCASPSDLRWVQEYMDVRRLCLDIIKAKAEGADA